MQRGSNMWCPTQAETSTHDLNEPDRQAEGRWDGGVHDACCLVGAACQLWMHACWLWLTHAAYAVPQCMLVMTEMCRSCCCRVVRYTQPSRLGSTLGLLHRRLKKSCLPSSKLCTAPQHTPCNITASFSLSCCLLFWQLVVLCE